MTRLDWFLDTFPTIVGLDGVPEVDNDSVTLSPPSRLLVDECCGIIGLADYCERYCRVNNTTYTTGTFFLIEPIINLITLDSPRTDSILASLYHFKSKTKITTWIKFDVF